VKLCFTLEIPKTPLVWTLNDRLHSWRSVVSVKLDCTEVMKQ